MKSYLVPLALLASLSTVLACSPPPEMPPEEGAGLYPVRSGTYVGFINTAGELVVPPRYEYVLDPSEGLVGVREDGLWGYLNGDTGEETIPVSFDDAGPFSEGLAPVSRSLLAGYIDTAGQPVIDYQYEAARPFKEGLGAAKANGLWGFLNRDGEWAIEPGFQRVRDFSQGLAAFQGAPFGPEVEAGAELSEEETLLEGNGYGFINTEGTMVIRPLYAEAYSFVDGLAAAKTVLRTWGFLSPEGGWAIEPTFFEARSFSEGLAAVRVGSKWGYIDRAGQMVIEPQFQDAQSFSAGLAAVRWEGPRWGYIDREGQRVINPLFESANPFRGPLAMVQPASEQYAYINHRGRTVWDGN